MISKALKIAKVPPAMISVKLMLCIRHMRVDIAMLLKLLPLLESQDMMMIIPIRICLSVTLLLHILNNDYSSPSVTVDDSVVLSCLRQFPKGTSPGASKLCAKHIFDTVLGSTAPAAVGCLYALLLSL